MHFKVLTLLATCRLIFGNQLFGDRICSLSKSLKMEIASYQPVVNNIINNIVFGRFKHNTYNELATFVDAFGPRPAGSKNLENAIDYMLNISMVRKLENVHAEQALVPHWVRGFESAVMVIPRFQNLAILGLGGTVGTPPEGITSEVLLLKSFKELELQSNKVKGKIVIFNPDFKSYDDETVSYRTTGAMRAAKYGAVACLVRSLTDFSLATPHTGSQKFDDSVPRIPAASIAPDHLHLIERIIERGQKVWITLKLYDVNLPPVMSRNTVGEYIGREKPEQVVLVSGHLDSWDVGQGAMDDGGGAFVSWNAVAILKALGYRPRRTIRAVLWTAEETGFEGVNAYYQAHKNEINNLKFLMESDEGTFNPYGLEVASGPIGGCIIQEILKLLQSINTTKYKESDKVGSDIQVWKKDNIPMATMLNENEKYFWYHHTAADTMDVEDPESLDKNTALFAAVSYIISDLSIDFPRN